MNVLARLWERVSGSQPLPPAWVVGLTGLAALIVVLNTGSWRLAGKVITIAHEGGHALVSLLSGRRLDGIRLHADSSGVTYSRGKRTGPGLVLTAAAGLAVRNVFGALAVLVTAAAVFVVSDYAPAAVQAGFAYLAAWFLLFGGLRPVLELARGRRRSVARGSRSWARGSDADQLAQMTGVPAGVWVTLFALVALAALVLGATLLPPAGWHA